MADDEEEGGTEIVQEEKDDVTEEVGIVPVVEEKRIEPPKYTVRPLLGERFQSQNVKDIILQTMGEQLTGRQYSATASMRWSKLIANAVRQRVQDLDMVRYKILVAATLIEMKGAGVKCGVRCLWDPETDNYVYADYRNESIYCHVTVYGVYTY